MSFHDSYFQACWSLYLLAVSNIKYARFTHASVALCINWLLSKEKFGHILLKTISLMYDSVYENYT